MTHDDLIERLTKATGPDRALDASLFRIDNPDLARSMPWPAWLIEQENGRDDFKAIPAYTASIDAALGLAKRLPGDHWYGILLDAVREFGTAGTLGPEHLARFVVLATLRALPASKGGDES